MPPELIRRAVAALKRVKREYATVQEVLLSERALPALGGERLQRLDEALAASELTFLLRLFAAFEGGLHSFGPHLPVPHPFTDQDGLKNKLDRIGADMKMPQSFRDIVDEDVRKLRNELLHGRSLVPRLTFETVYELMRSFYRGCH